MTVYIGLGSNLVNPAQQIQQAKQAIAQLPSTKGLLMSSLYSSPPMGPQDQPDYINAVIALDTTLSPHELLDTLQQIEQQQGRVRSRHWGERTLDLDILLYDNDVISDARLTIPHPGIAERAFVLYPLAEIAPEIEIPKHGKIANLLPLCDKNGLERITDNLYE